MPNTINNQVRYINEKNLLDYIGKGRSYRSTKTSIVIVRKGRIKFMKSFETVTLAGGNIYFLFPNGFFELKETSTDLEITIVSIDIELFSQLSFEFNRLEVYQFLISNYSNKFIISESVVTELDKLTEILRLNLHKTESKFSSTILLNLLNVLVYTVFEAINALQNFTGSGIMDRKQELVFEFLKLLSNNYKRERKVSFYAHKLSVSSRYLSSTIKSVTKKTANQVIHQYIISEAKVLLTSSNKKITEIASELNFNDQYYFSNFFKKQTGLNPSGFKEKNKKEYNYTSI